MNPSALVRQFLRFGVVGVVATVVDFGVLILLAELGILPAVPAAAVSFIASVVVNYVLSMRFVFARREDMRRRTEFVVFVLLSVIGLGINELIMWVGTDLLSIHYVIGKVAATVIVLLWNFISRKIWLEARPTNGKMPANV